MLPSLQTGRVDLVMAGMSDLPTRRELQDFVDYLKTGAQFYTTVANAKEIKSTADLCGKKVGASRSTNWPKQIGEWSDANRSEEHTSELQSLMRISYAVFCLKTNIHNKSKLHKKNTKTN